MITEILTYLLAAAGVLFGWWWLTGNAPWKGLRASRQGSPAAAPAPIAATTETQAVLVEIRAMKQMLADILVRLDDRQPAPATSLQEETFELPAMDIDLPEKDPAADVYLLAEQGLSSRDIAKQTGLSRGEVDLILRLRAVEMAVGE